VAHFADSTSARLGSDIDNEDVASCGGFAISPSENATDFHVGESGIGLTTLHMQAHFAYRGGLYLSELDCPVADSRGARLQ